MKVMEQIIFWSSYGFCLIITLPEVEIKPHRLSQKTAYRKEPHISSTDNTKAHNVSDG
jgi:hypothetical protein